MRRGLMTFGLLVLTGLCVRAGLGQVAVAVPVEAAPDAGVMTLHAYTDLVQIPVLVLDTRRQRLPRVDPGLFRMTLNSGPLFQPTHVRVEGDDPITLAILVDGDAQKNDLLRGVADGVASLVGGSPQRGVPGVGSLLPQDHLLFYVMDCGRIRSLVSLPEGEGALGPALAALEVHHPAGGGGRADTMACMAPSRLWDAMALVTKELSVLPGRRVLLAITEGHDGGSATGWSALKSYAMHEGIAIFSLSHPDMQERTVHLIEPEDHMTSVCEFSGGIRLWSTSRDLSKSLGEFLRLVRERYIIDFPRPAKAKAGVLSVRVSLLKRDAFIRPSGVTFELPDPKLLTDPTTVPSDPSRGPTIGTRRPLKVR